VLTSRRGAFHGHPRHQARMKSNGQIARRAMAMTDDPWSSFETVRLAWRDAGIHH